MFNGGSDLPPKPFQLIKQDDKFFSRLLSKESSASNPSFRVYYGGAPSSVPFMWETQPGTPKHPRFADSLPPLTPPPSYHHSSSNKYDIFPQKKCSRSDLLRVLFLKTSLKKPKNVANPTCSLRSSSSSFSNSSVFAPMTPMRRWLERWFSSRRLMSYDSSIDDEDEHARSPPTSTQCFGGSRKWRSISARGLYGQ